MKLADLRPRVVLGMSAPPAVVRAVSGYAQSPFEGGRLAAEAVVFVSRALQGGAPDAYARAIAEVQCAVIQTALDYSDGNKARAAASLGMNRNTMHALMRRHRIASRARGGNHGL